MRFNFNITEPSNITADIFDSRDELVTRISNKRTFRLAGNHILIWNKRPSRLTKQFYEKNDYKKSAISDLKKAVPNGEYKIKIIAEATYSSRTYFEKIKEIKFDL